MREQERRAGRQAGWTLGSRQRHQLRCFELARSNGRRTGSVEKTGPSGARFTMKELALRRRSHWRSEDILKTGGQEGRGCGRRRNQHAGSWSELVGAARHEQQQQQQQQLRVPSLSRANPAGTLVQPACDLPSKIVARVPGPCTVLGRSRTTEAHAPSDDRGVRSLTSIENGWTNYDEPCRCCVLLPRAVQKRLWQTHKGSRRDDLLLRGKRRGRQAALARRRPARGRISGGFSQMHGRREKEQTQMH
jgi:hypothetical protein